MHQSVSGPITEYQCQGPYGADFCRKTMGKGKDWHPGVMGHKYRADSFSYFVLEILKQAVSMVAMAQMRGKKDLSALHDEAHHFLNHHLYRGNFSAKKSTDHHKFALPQPLMCSNAVCKKDWSCYTNFEPRKANNFSLGLRVVGGSIPTGWTRNLSWFDVAGVAKARSENRGYSDLKFIFITNVRGEGPLEDKDGGVLTLDVVPRSNSSIWLCQVQRGFAKYSGDKGTLDVDASVAITLNVPESVKREDPFASGKKGKRLTLSPVQDECFETEPVPAGRHFLSIWPKLRSKQINIAYLIVW
ncbi:unnamed protein product [Symbiodinium microadriaticum]|nr:unnamed protein product [Symbiodinium microadriaticum]